MFSRSSSANCPAFATIAAAARSGAGSAPSPPTGLRGFQRKSRTHPLTLASEEGGLDLEQLEDPASPLSQLWDQEHDRFLARRLLRLIEGEFEPATWQAFKKVALEGARASAVAVELNISVNAVFIAKSRVMRRLRQEIQRLLD
jgi:RNA polymerase sigma-70 factor (ECF subfamily)